MLCTLCYFLFHCLCLCLLSLLCILSRLQATIRRSEVANAADTVLHLLCCSLCCFQTQRLSLLLLCTLSHLQAAPGTDGITHTVCQHKQNSEARDCGEGRWVAGRDDNIERQCKMHMRCQERNHQGTHEKQCDHQGGKIKNPEAVLGSQLLSKAEACCCCSVA